MNCLILLLLFILSNAMGKPLSDNKNYDELCSCNSHQGFIALFDIKSPKVCEIDCGNYKVMCFNEGTECGIVVIKTSLDDNNNNYNNNDDDTSFSDNEQKIAFMAALSIIHIFIIIIAICIKCSNSNNNNSSKTYNRTLNSSHPSSTNSNSNTNSNIPKKNTKNDILPEYTSIDVTEIPIQSEMTYSCFTPVNNYNLPTYEEAMASNNSTATTTTNKNNIN